MKQILILLLALSFSSVQAGAQNADSTQTKKDNSYNARFNKYLSQNDTVFAKSVMSDWREESPNDPELYVAMFNYYMITSMDKVAEMTKLKPADTDCTLFPLRDSLGNATGYIVTRTVYKENQAAAAIEAISKGIENYPGRLDMRYCKIYLLGKQKRWNDFTNEILATITYAESHNNQWLWASGMPLENGKEALAMSLEEYQQQLFNGDVNGTNMRAIAEAMLKGDSKNIGNLNYMAVSYIKDTDYSKALQSLKKADKIRKDDPAVIKNMSYVYKQTGDERRMNECLEKLKKIMEAEKAANAEKAGVDR